MPKLLYRNIFNERHIKFVVTGLEFDIGLLDDLVPELRSLLIIVPTVLSSLREPIVLKAHVSLEDDRRLLGENADLICALAGVEELAFDSTVCSGETDATIVIGSITVLIHDVIDRVAELARLKKQQQTLAKGIASAERNLGNPKFLEKAKHLVEFENRRLAKYKEELAAVEKALAQLQ